MVKRESGETQKINILVLLWHSTVDSSVTAGGIRRIIEFIKRTPSDMHFYILDNKPTVFDFTQPGVTVLEYTYPGFVHFLLKNNFVLGRAIEWFLSFVKLTIQGVRIIRQKKCSIVYVPTSELLFLFLPAVFLKIICRVKFVSDILNFSLPYGSISNFYNQMRLKKYSVVRSVLLPVYIKVQLLIMKKLFSKIDYIVTVSQHLSDSIKNQGARCPVTFTPSGVDCRYIESVCEQPITFEGVFVGRHNIAKGIFDLIEAWRIVVEKIPNARLAMVGFCDVDTRKQIDDKLKKYSLKDNIFVKGALSEEDKIKTIKSGKVFIHLGLMEPLVPVITVLEGLACGLPTVLYDQPSYKEHPEIYNHASFALVKHGDFRAAAEKVVKFINLNGSLREKIKKEAVQYALQYDWDSIAGIEFDAIRSFKKIT